MKKLVCLLFMLSCTFLMACKNENSDSKIRFVVCADYPPFEYKFNGNFVGFDIELAKHIAKVLGKEAVFQDLPFNALLIAVENGLADVAISTITATESRKQKFDFSDIYYTESLAMVFPKSQPMLHVFELPDKKIACQLGTTMEIWLKQHALKTEIVTLDHNPQAIEALKIQQVDGVLMDTIQAVEFSKRNPQLAYQTIARADTGYALALKKNSTLTNQINKALKLLEEKGIIEELKKQYLKVDP